MNSFVAVASALLERQTICNTSGEIQSRLSRLLSSEPRVRVVSFLNAHAVIRARRDSDFYDALLASEILFRDGSGIGMLMRRLGENPGLNMNGTDLIPLLFDHLPRNSHIALLGTKDHILDLTRIAVQKKGFANITTLDGFRRQNEYIDLLKHSAPKLVVLGMGMPKQEQLSKMISQEPSLRQKDIVVVNGGAILDFMSGQVPRAPKLFQKLGIEWLYRLVLEPKRMLPRFLDSVNFAINVIINGSSFTQHRKDGNTSYDK